MRAATSRKVRRTVGTALASSLLSLFPANARAETTSFVKGPYIQGLTTRSVVVRFETTTPAPGRLDVRGEGFATSIPFSADTFQSLTVDGLAPATAYTYVAHVGDTASPEARFVTAPEDGRPFTFLAYGDNRTDETAHSAVVRAMLRTPSDFLVHTGDMVLDGGDEVAWNAFFQIETPLLASRCVFACVGNHELVGSGAKNFLRYFHPGFRGEEAALHTTTRWGNTRFFFVNAMAPWSGESERAWLEGALARADTEDGVVNRIVVLHHGPYSSGPHGDNERFFAPDTLASLRRHRVSLLLAGHDHLYERGELAGIRYLVTGGGGAPLYKPRRNASVATEALASTYHFVVVHVDGATITTDALRPDGSRLERCTLVPDAKWACDPSLPQFVAEGPPAPPRRGKNACDCALAPAADDPGSFAAIVAFTLALAGGVARRARRRS